MILLLHVYLPPPIEVGVFEFKTPASMGGIISGGVKSPSENLMFYDL